MLPSVLAATDLFCRDYLTCRHEFLRACDAVGDILRRQLHWQLPLPNIRYGLSSGDELSTDAVYLGDPDAEKVLVLISATHGVEGYCGSALQRLLLTQLAAGHIALPSDRAVVMLHALNPWGMYRARRCDHQGIDLNRNFIDVAPPPAAHPDYPQVLDCLTVSDPGVRWQALGQLRDQWGQQHFDQVFSGGQYQHAWAPFFGGREPAYAQRVIDELIDHWSLAQRELVVLDLHTGLGPWGYGELISDHAAASAGNRFAQRLFGPSVAVTAEGNSFSVPKRGLLDYRWHQMMGERGCFLTLEFGSYGTDSLFDVLLDDHDYWRRFPDPDVSDADYLRVRNRMLDHFCPDDTLWQQSVLLRGWQLSHHLLDTPAWQ